MGTAGDKLGYTLYVDDVNNDGYAEVMTASPGSVSDTGIMRLLVVDDRFEDPAAPYFGPNNTRFTSSDANPFLSFPGGRPGTRTGAIPTPDLVMAGNEVGCVVKV